MIRTWEDAVTAATAYAAVVLMLCFASCSTKNTVTADGLPTHLPEIHLDGSSSTPPHSMASYEYPFDSNGRYVSDWAAEGERRAGRSASATIDDSSKWGRSHGGAASSRKTASSSKSKSKSTGSSSKGGASKSGSGGTTAAGGTSKPPSPTGTSSKSKTGTTAKAASSKGGGRSYTVKKGDTLSHIAGQYGTTVSKIKAANGLRSDFLSIGKVLRIP